MLPDATVRYADHDEAVIDLHLPDRSADRVVVLLHGGFWKAEWDRRHTRPMARALADRGCLVATPEYRRVRAGGGWPTTGADVHAAIGRLPGLLEGLGVPDVPSGPPIVTGHSAGGHLALWAATTGLAVARVVALAPVCDLREAIRLDLGSGATRALLGEHAPAEADPMTLFGQHPAAEIAIIHGVEDDDVPVTLSRRFVAAHPWVSLIEVPGDHYGVIEPGSAVWPTVLEQLTSD